MHFWIVIFASEMILLQAKIEFFETPFMEDTKYTSGKSYYKLYLLLSASTMMIFETPFLEYKKYTFKKITLDFKTSIPK